jgi:ribonuclease HI
LLRIGAKERELSGHEPATTNNRMELMGAIAALEALKRPVHVILQSDSSYVVKGMNEWVAGWQRNGWRSGKEKKPVANRDLWERLVAAAAPHEVEFQWVRGHAGHAENERVDRLATAAARGETPAPAPPEADLRIELSAPASIACALVGGAKAKVPAWCLRGPGHVGVHCARGDGSAPCPHASFTLDATAKVRDRTGGIDALEGALLRAFLRGLSGETT